MWLLKRKERKELRGSTMPTNIGKRSMNSYYDYTHKNGLYNSSTNSSSKGEEHSNQELPLYGKLDPKPPLTRPKLSFLLPLCFSQVRVFELHIYISYLENQTNHKNIYISYSKNQTNSKCISIYHVIYM